MIPESIQKAQKSLSSASLPLCGLNDKYFNRTLYNY